MLKRIVSAIDGSDNARRAVEAAGGLAKDYGADLLLVHVVGSGRIPPALEHLAEVEHMIPDPRSPDPQNVANVFGNLATVARTPSTSVAAQEVHRALGQRLLQDAMMIARGKGADSVKVMLCEGDPDEAIVDAAKQFDADLVVLGTRGLSDLKELLLGSVSHSVVQLSPCSCLVVK